MRIVCPSCKKVLEDVPADYPPRPFCSARCKLADLGNWLSERYCISEPSPPGSRQEDEELH
ncbi:MAG TPA: DNA gyrase inhibitor YacG [Polyangiaceae bacterium]|nr:DNA gyrase inhibitor YacG [Polyangiaceae bacterium]